MYILNLKLEIQFLDGFAMEKLCVLKSHVKMNLG